MCKKLFFGQLISLNYRKYKIISKKNKNYFIHSALLLIQHIQILMKIINFQLVMTIFEVYRNLCEPLYNSYSGLNLDYLEIHEENRKAICMFYLL